MSERVTLRDVQLEAAREAFEEACATAGMGLRLLRAAVRIDLRVAVEHLVAAWRCGDERVPQRRAGDQPWRSRGGDA
jgi:hypothetical protein